MDKNTQKHVIYKCTKGNSAKINIDQDIGKTKFNALLI